MIDTGSRERKFGSQERGRLWIRGYRQASVLWTFTLVTKTTGALGLADEIRARLQINS